MRTLYCDNNKFQYSALTSLKVEHCKTLFEKCTQSLHYSAVVQKVILKEINGTIL